MSMNGVLSVEQRKRMIEAALGRRPLDLLLKDVRLVNVYTGRVEPADLGILGGRLVSLGAAGLPAAETHDCGGLFAVPGLIDTHVHVDSTLLTPQALAELIVPHGTTALLADPMEISNVAGLPGLQALLAGAAGLPYHLWVEVPSRVPTAPGLETTGGELGLSEVQQILDWESCVSLGELDPSKVLGLRDEYLAKVAAAHALGKIANGHAAGLTGRELEAYVCGGLADDHECVDIDDALARLHLGLPVLVREGSSERNLELILEGALRLGLDTRHLMFCTDDKHPDDIQREGHIDYMVNRAIELGCAPLDAIRMATLNAAEHFHLEAQVGSLAIGRWADVLLCERLERLEPVQVYFQGQLVARQGGLTAPPAPGSFPDWLRHTVHVSRGAAPADFRLAAPPDAAEGSSLPVRLIELVPDQIINREGQVELRVMDGALSADPAQDVLKLAVVERYGKRGTIGITFVRGFGLKDGALASSVSHDHHNIVVVGTNDVDMAACVRAVVELQGGLAAAQHGREIARLPLPLGGLMSDRPAGQVIAALGELNAAARRLGTALQAPFMSLSFISLPTVPALGLTDFGLVDVHAHALVSPFL